MLGELGILLAGAGIAAAGGAYAWERIRIWRAGSWWGRVSSEPASQDDDGDGDGDTEAWELFS